MTNLTCEIRCAKVIFYGRENCQFFHFWSNPKKSALHLCLFFDFSLNFSKKSKFFTKSKKRAYNKKVHTKMPILQKSSKNQLFFLKNRFTALKFSPNLKI